MYLTIEERLEVYEEVLKEFQHNRKIAEKAVSGICEYLLELSSKYTGIDDFDNFQDQKILETEFPEFYSQKPKGYADDDYWWKWSKRSNDCRERALKKCIELVKKTLENEDDN